MVLQKPAPFTVSSASNAGSTRKKTTTVKHQNAMSVVIAEIVETVTTTAEIVVEIAVKVVAVRTIARKARLPLNNLQA
jgi:hypothetical protein